MSSFLPILLSSHLPFSFFFSIIPPSFLSPSIIHLHYPFPSIFNTNTLIEYQSARLRDEGIQHHCCLRGAYTITHNSCNESKSFARCSENTGMQMHSQRQCFTKMRARQMCSYVLHTWAHLIITITWCMIITSPNLYPKRPRLREARKHL